MASRSTSNSYSFPNREGNTYTVHILLSMEGSWFLCLTHIRLLCVMSRAYVENGCHYDRAAGDLVDVLV